MAFRSIVASALIAVLMAGPAGASDAPAFLVAMDQARVLKVPRPATTVIIGNPAIADVTVQDATTLVLTGRSYGTTNLVILDADGGAMVDETVGVTSSEAGTVRIYRQAERQTYACMPTCEPKVTIGDTDSAFSDAAGQFSRVQGMAMSAMK